MTDDELRTIIRRFGPHFTAALKAFAAALPVTDRAVRYWLAKDRKIRPLVAARIRSLKPTKP